MITFLLFIIAAMATGLAYVFVLRDATLRGQMGFVGTYYNYVIVIAVFCVVVGFVITSWFLLLLPIALAAWCGIIWLRAHGSDLLGTP